MSRRKPDARNPTRPAAKGGSSHSKSRDKRPGAGSGEPGRANQAHGKVASKPAGSKPYGAKPRPYGSQGKPTRESRPEGRPEGRSDRRDERRDDRRESGKRDFAPKRPEGRPERDSGQATGRDAGRGQEQRHGDRHGAHTSGYGGDKFAPRNREYRGDLPVWLYGSHAVLAALENEERLIRRILLTREAREALQDRLPRLSQQPETVDKLKLDNLLPPGAVHQGIAMLTDPLDDPGVESLKEPLDEEGGREVVLLLDHVTDPRNVGAILRSAAAFGARAVIVTDRHAPEATGALAKAASGGLEVVPLIRVTNLSRALDLLAEYGFWRVGLEMETEKSLAEAVSDIKRVALVLGAEDEGLRRLTREKCDFLARLPMTGAVESLNVSAAAAVALYECVRG
ncbi:MAG: 23S rRNA (guanosine(2251)-2'-O)-methyltransferase RlmB [Ferrovibrio sp.]|uniref:23S rRNA (guanosine(2251)-2'-O)-methyltransferase RlmB n=1 Tax=Ferrovibrio sp. TaxID=1917215 RepID=UPI0026232E0C|nr:23S rRNA (guanosine(2251)-2'-O)-methyltransferase RlmB [Ferrovibrio sp.]MCW0232117.1 23S rRNA (guanosine(2251)-2'-O)-methyltransferase RlmB [Ferrovibrio sp.]